MDEIDAVELDAEEAPHLVGYIKERFLEAEHGRQTEELRWLSSYKNYRGINDGTTAYTATEKSKVFIKITKVKVLAAFGQIIDILFANNKFPITVSNTPIPEGVAEFAHIPSPEELQLPDDIGNVPLNQLGFEGGDMQEFLAGLKEKYKGSSLVEGPAILGTAQIEPAAIAARNMEKQIHDQLTDTNAITILRHAIFECCLLGTGIIKGPFNYNKTVHNWKLDEQGYKVYEPYNKVIPKMEAVSCWNFYPDPAAISLEDAEYIVQRHRMNREQLRSLMSRPYFDKKVINKVLSESPHYEHRPFEPEIHSEGDDYLFTDKRYEVFEYWGMLDASLARVFGLDIPKEMEDLEAVQVNAWITGNQVLRLVLNPFVPARLPYLAFPYELNPYQLFGVGVGENMQDTQTLMNGHMRMAIDNLALAGNLVFDIDETQLVPGQNMEIFPGKIFRRQSGQSGTAVNGLKFPNTAPENLQLFDTARRLSDEQTGIPSVLHGQTGVTGTGRTASGLSMLMNSGNLSIKTVIKNIDDFLLKPLGESYFQWNMQFNDDNAEIIGDLEIKPKGTSSIMQKEVRTQRLTTLLQTVANPMLAPFIKIPNLMKELAISQDIDPDQLVNDPNEAAIFADILRGLMDATQNGTGPSPNSQQPENMGADTDVPVGANPMDPSGVGGGIIGTGTAPVAGESGFTGNIVPIEGTSEV
jgi:hypothetical protein|tara:strand:- start:56 stop:2143 length:2088 start_codon:yes stop_codon:yes gene_type:complete